MSVALFNREFGFVFGFEAQGQWLRIPIFQVWRPLTFSFQIMILDLEATGFGFSFLSVKMEVSLASTLVSASYHRQGFGFGFEATSQAFNPTLM